MNTAENAKIDSYARRQILGNGRPSYIHKIARAINGR